MKTTLELLSVIKEIAEAIHEKFGCPKIDFPERAKIFTRWPDCQNHFGDELACQLLIDVAFENDTWWAENIGPDSYYHVSLETVQKVLTLVHSLTPLTTNEQVEEIFEALDHDNTDQYQIVSEIMDPRGELLMNDEHIGYDTYIGTHEQFAEYLKGAGWYSEFVQNHEETWRNECPDEDPITPTEKEWINDTINENCSRWDGNLDYESL